MYDCMFIVALEKDHRVFGRNVVYLNKEFMPEIVEFSLFFVL